MRTTIAAAISLFALAAPANAAELAKVQIGEGRTFPESMSATSDGTLYAGSLTGGVVFKAPPGATTATPFIQKPADGPQSIHGVWADNRNGLLWVCYADSGNPTAPGAQPSAAKAYDIGTGALKGSFSLGKPSLCNDITTTQDGSVYITDTVGGRVFRLAPGAADLVEWLKDDRLKGADGIAAASDGTIYVSSVTSNMLYRVQAKADGSAGPMAQIALSQPLKGIDGMRFGTDGVLYAAEDKGNEAVGITIEGDRGTVKVLGTGYDGPTAVQPAGKTLWVLENKAGKRSDPNEQGPFFAIPVAIPAGS
jgi:sugar lactone lactonase YvrE